MSTCDKLIKARLGMLALAEELQNISLACKRAGISRSHFYEIKEAFEKYGADAPVLRVRPMVRAIGTRRMHNGALRKPPFQRPAKTV